MTETPWLFPRRDTRHTSPVKIGEDERVGDVVHRHLTDERGLADRLQTLQSVLVRRRQQWLNLDFAR